MSETDGELYVLCIAFGTITRARVDKYVLVKETESSWIVRQNGSNRRLLKSAYFGFTSLESLRAEVANRREKETTEAKALLGKLKNPNIYVTDVTPDLPRKMTKRELARAFDR